MRRAASLYSYHYPFLKPDLVPDARKRALERIRKSLETLYDANALELGFVPDGHWFKWFNPKIAVRCIRMAPYGLSHIPLIAFLQNDMALPL